MATAPKTVDRRVQRTRQLLRQAAIEVMHEKGFTAMTVLDITEQANLNRGTFYAHYLDKYALLEELVRDQFHDRLVKHLPAHAAWNRQTLRLIIQIALEHFEYEYKLIDPAEVLDPLLERATKEELSRLLANFLRQVRAGSGQKETASKVAVETVARIMSWGILGAATYWCQVPDHVPAEQAAGEVMLVLLEGVGKLIPD